MSLNKKLKVAVLMGGIGSERQISIEGGSCVAEALKQADFDVILYDINPDKLDILDDNSIDIFFPVLHGQFGEDGQLQQILEDKSLIYTGSGPDACKLALDKMKSKEIFVKEGITTPVAIEFNQDTNIKQLEQQLSDLAEKYVVKPVKEGSSFGVVITDTPQTAISEAKKCLDEFSDCMIEEFIAGREITAGMLNSDILPIIEIKPKNAFYDYNAKYVDDKTEFLFDTIQDSEIIEKISRAAFSSFKALGCRDFSRVDFLLSENNVPYVLEVNAIPGFTNHSLLPMAAAKAGIPMSELCKKIVESAYSSQIKQQV